MLALRWSAQEAQERVVALDEIGVAVTVPASWSTVETDVPEHPQSPLAQAAIAAPEGHHGQVLASYVFRIGELDDAVADLRSWYGRQGADILEEWSSTVDGRDARVMRYELADEQDRPQLHLTYEIEVDDLTSVRLDIGGLPADDDASTDALERIGETVRLEPPAVGVDRELLTVDEDGLVGEFWAPGDPDGRRPGILYLGGSGGGVPFGGGPLALAGYPTLALAYHGADGLPDTLSEIPLEGFREGLEWLAARPEVDPERLIVWGTSRGGEAALLIGSTFPDAVSGGVVANVPSDRAGPSYPDGTRAAWTLDGEPVADRDEQGRVLLGGMPIEVERIEVPVLLTCGEQDARWPSCTMSRWVVARFEDHDHPHPVTLHAYEDAGHDAILPPLPVPADVREAGNQGWRDALRFLDDL